MADAGGAKFPEPAAPAAAAPATAAASGIAAAAPAAAAAHGQLPPVLHRLPHRAAAAAAPASAEVGKKVYDQVCAACHAAGVAGAPKLGDKAAWAPRLKEGMDAVHAFALKGKGVMPPKGGYAGPDADVIAAVDYMANASK
ncbi:c-type cytochrome [Cupriavidus basilensis]